MTSSSRYDNTASLTTDVESASDSRMSSATGLQNLAGEGPGVPMRTDRLVVPKLAVAESLGVLQPSAARDNRRCAAYQSQSPNCKAINSAVQDIFGISRIQSCHG